MEEKHSVLQERDGALEKPQKVSLLLTGLELDELCPSAPTLLPGRAECQRSLS